jgi:mediator of RNA polymerase II transcription subunit 5
MVLQNLLSPPSISSESSSLLTTLLPLIAPPLSHSLRELQKREPSRQDIEPLQRILKPHLNTIARTTASQSPELESWATTSAGGLTNALRMTIQSLVLWSSTADIHISPASYTHRQLLLAVQLFGAQRVISILISELQTQTRDGNGALALDITVALICAPSSTLADIAMGLGRQGRMGLVDALKAEVDPDIKLEGVDTSRVETTVRLWRRVEAQLGMETQQGAGGVVDGVVGAGLADAAVDGGLADGVVGTEMGGLVGDIDDVLGAAREEAEDVLKGAAVGLGEMDLG